jgi:tetratricopeptide (TPR) repeat protein
LTELELRNLFSFTMGIAVLAGGAWAIKRWLGGGKNPSPTQPDNRPLDPILEATQAGNWVKAARLALDAGDWRTASDHFLQAQRPLDAARALRKAEAWREAAEQFERGRDFVSASQCFLKADRKSDALRVMEQTDDLQKAAELADQIGDFRKGAQLYQRLGKNTEAADRFQRAGDNVRAGTLRAEVAERNEQWREAAQGWVQAQVWDRALACLDRAGDDRGAAQLLQRLGKLEAAADRLVRAGAFAEAGTIFEQQGLFRKAAMSHQKAGDTERAIRCLTLEGDKIAVIKLRQAMGQTEEALRVAQAVSPTDSAYIEAVQIVAIIHINRGETAAAARTLLTLLDAPLAPAIKVATGRRTAELFLQLRDGSSGRQVLDKLAGLIRQGSDEERWVLEIQKKFAELPVDLARSTPAIAHTSSATPTIAMNLANAEHTESFDDEIAVTEPTAIYPGGRGDTRRAEDHGSAADDDVPLTTAGWPTGVPTGLADRYGDLERLGQGGNGVVFRATDKLLGRQVVLKFMIQGTMPSETARKYFLREVKLSASLNHPNIVHIYDMGNTDDVLWYAMEFVDGVPLTAHLALGQPIRDIVFLMSVVDQLCAALDHAHVQGLVHRDIKPDNVLVANDGTVKLLDFGLARAMDEGFGEQSVLAGTPYYMAPEQLDGSTVDHRADIYALGVVLFRMFTGHLPFSDGNIFVAHAVQPVPDPRQFNRDLPIEAVAVVMKAMAKKPADRYSNCRQIALDVHAALFGHMRAG